MVSADSKFSRVLTETSGMFNKLNLEKVAIIGAQHILASTLELFKFILSLKIQPSQVFLHGKCYSSSHISYDSFIKLGFYVAPSSFYFNSHLAYDSQYKNNLHDFTKYALSKINWDLCEKLIVLDDGGYLISNICKHHIPENVSVVGVEQTSSGFHYLKRQNLSFPVLNVARSKAKLRIETPFIIRSFMKKFFEYISFEQLRDSNVLIIGKGNIGKALVRDLIHCKTYFYDLKDNSELLLPLISQSDIIVGCTGNTSIPSSLHKHIKKNATLLSISSSDREFDAYHIRKAFSENSDPLRSYSTPNLNLIQSGFPVNFWGTPHNIPLSDIAITSALLLESILFAAQSNDLANKIITPDGFRQDQIIKSFNHNKLSRQAI